MRRLRRADEPRRCGRDPDIGDEVSARCVVFVRVKGPESHDPGWLRHCDDKPTVWARHDLTVLVQQPEVWCDDLLCGWRADRKHDARVDEAEFHVQPGSTGADFSRFDWPGFHTPVLEGTVEAADQIGNPDVSPMNAGLSEHLIQQLPRRAGERQSSLVVGGAG
jgi:hypothetical protein